MMYPPRALPLPVEEVEVRGHLFIHHGLPTTETTKLPGLRECHDEEHTEPQWIPHPHTHTAPLPLEEWSWE